VSEHDHQVSLFDWRDHIGVREFPELEWMFAIPNGGHRKISVARRLKREGVKAGVLDVLIPIPRGNYIGMWIEMKFGKNKLTKEQAAFMEKMRDFGYHCAVAYVVDDAVKEVRNYMQMEKHEAGRENKKHD